MSGEVYSIKLNIWFSVVNKRNVSNLSWISKGENTFKVLHKLNELMKNDKQIAFTELSFQPGDWKRGTGKTGTIKNAGVETREWKTRDHLTWVENARLDSYGTPKLQVK